LNPRIAPFETSELWLALVAALLPVLVAHGAISQEMAALALTAAGTAVPLVLQAIVHKFRAGLVPFVHPAPPPAAVQGGTK
jgi:hypothetical protein